MTSSYLLRKEEKRNKRLIVYHKSLRDAVTRKKEKREKKEKNKKTLFAPVTHDIYR